MARERAEERERGTPRSPMDIHSHPRAPPPSAFLSICGERFYTPSPRAFAVYPFISSSPSLTFVQCYSAATVDSRSHPRRRKSSEILARS